MLNEYEKLNHSSCKILLQTGSNKLTIFSFRKGKQTIRAPSIVTINPLSVWDASPNLFKSICDRYE